MTINHLSKKNNTLFRRRLTDWMPLIETKKYSTPFYRHHGRKAYGRHFVIKKRGYRKEYAIYIKKENKLRRLEDKEMLKRSFTFDRFVYPYKALLDKIKRRYVS